MLSKKENEVLLEKRISQLNLKGNIIFAFDFDELIVDEHLTSKISKLVSKPINFEIANKLGFNSFEGLKYLNGLFYGYDYKDYKCVRDKTAKEVIWTPGLEQLISDLQKKYSVIVISAGLKDICYAKLKEIDFDERNILSSEFLVEDGVITDPKLIVSKELKGYIIKELKKNYKIISIGHSMGDKDMLDNAHVSISLNSKIPNLAKYNVTSAKEILEVIEKVIQEI